LSRFLAKSEPEETIQEHTNNLLKNFYLLQELYPNIKHLNWEILRLSCLYHDLGKMNTKFQNKILKRIGYELLDDELVDVEEVYHNYLSPAFLPKNKLKQEYNPKDIKVLYQSIYRHHDRKLPHFEDMKEVIEKDLKNFLAEFCIKDYEYLKDIDLSEGLNYKYRKEVNNPIIPREDGIDVFYSYVITKGLLNKIDYAASSYIGGNRISVEIPNKDLEQKVNNFFIEKSLSKNDLQKYMESNKEENNVIIASTGVGKTEASLLWIGNDKGFFTLPLRVSINAIFDRIKAKDIRFEDVGLLHSDTYSEYLKRTNNERFDDYYYHQTKQMSLPLTVCTLDQLIDFIFRYEGFEIKLATLSYSKIVIDEIQAYSPDFIGYLICALKLITDVGGKFSIVTATFPPIVEYLLVKNRIPFKKGPEFLKQQVRHNVKVVEEELVLDRFVENYKNKKVLVICNTVKKAQSIYGELKRLVKDTDIKLLHSRFIKKDRKKLEDEILEIGNKKSKKVGIWITTQIVEASLDIDFDELHTELSDLSGLFQRMGRVYRNRELENEQNFNTYIYVGTEEYMPSGVNKGDKSLVDIDIFNYGKSELLKQGDKIFDEELKMQMIRNVYTVENLKDSRYFKKIENTIKYVMDIEEYFFTKGEQKLRDIKNESIIPIKIYEDNKDYIDDVIRNINMFQGKENKAYREAEKEKIRDFLVDIPNYMVMDKTYKYLKLDKYNEIKILNIEYQNELGVVNEKNDVEKQSNNDNFF